MLDEISNVRAITPLLTAGWAVSRRGSASAFEGASKGPSQAQERWLRRALMTLGPSAYGRALGLDRVDDVRSFRDRAPIVGWDEVAPWVDRIAAGERDVLTTDPVLVFERTSGSTALPKRVPYTKGLLDDFGAATGPWLDDLFRAFPSMFTSRQYWSVSPAARAPETTPSGIRVGFEDDTEYFDPLTRAAMKQLLVVPSEVARSRSIDDWRHRTLVHLLEADDLGFVSIWNPSFLSVLLEGLSERVPTLSSELSASRRTALLRSLETGSFDGGAMWPSLALISCWTDAWAETALPELRRFFPRVPIQGKGLLATEGVVSFPLWGQPAPVAAVTSHFLEFEALEDDGRPIRLVHELRSGARYAPIITTRGGLVRYRLPDVVRCVGFWRALPLLRFAGRLDKTSDLRGEKLSAVVVEAAVRDAFAGVKTDFLLVAPSLEPAGYLVFVDSEEAEPSLVRARDALEERLMGEHHYRYCRDVGQLAPLRLISVQHGRAAWLETLRARGLKLGDIKPSAFDLQPDWERAFVRR